MGAEEGEETVLTVVNRYWDTLMSSAILKADPQHPACLPIHVALLVELEKTSDLFRLKR